MIINLSVHQMTPYNHQQFRPQTTTVENKATHTQGGNSFEELLNAQMAGSTTITTSRKR
ncbi:hypothetical protein [Paenibacillus campi]|uniref:hypothetical protein n=1 Tax=Paenibacillus campi TaxID=3106031 RepID=UPI002AFE136D|nr:MULTISPECIES: hypothetical protein [unclassified Paenibacillus]